MITKATAGDYYACTDSRTLYKDLTSSLEDRRIVNAVQLYKDNERAKIRPVNGRLYYVWETNELWTYDSGWTLKIGRSRDYNGYIYQNGYIKDISPVDSTASEPGTGVLDNNGLLGDGSVVIRDSNRLVKGKIAIDSEDSSLIVSSFLGGGMSFYPNGDNTLGSLRIYNKHIDEVTLEILQDKAISWFQGETNGTDDFYVNIDGGTVEPTEVPIEYNSIIITTSAERTGVNTNNETFIIRQDFTITIYSDLTTTVKIVTSDNSNDPQGVEVIDENDRLSTIYMNPGVVTSERVAHAKREVSADGNLVVTTAENIILTILTSKNSAEVGYNAMIDYTQSSIKDEATAGYLLFQTQANVIMHYRYVLMHEGNFNIHKYVTPELVLEKLQECEPPLDIVVKYLGMIGEDGELIKFTPEDFASKVHKHLSGSFNSFGVYEEQDLVDLDEVVYKLIQKALVNGMENTTGLTVYTTEYVETDPDLTGGYGIERMKIYFDTNETMIEFQDYDVSAMTEDEIEATIPPEEERYKNPVMGTVAVDLSKNQVTARLIVNPYGHKHYLKDMKDYDEFLEWLSNEYVHQSDTVKLPYGEIAGVNEGDKLIYTDVDGRMPVDITGTAADASKLDHEVDLIIHDTYSDTDIGQALDVDLSEDTVTIDITITGETHKHDRYVLNENAVRDPIDEANNDQVGVTVPSMDENRIIKDQYLPVNVKYAMYYAGEFNPDTGYPVTPERPYAVFVANVSGYINNSPAEEYFKTGDLALYTGLFNDAPVWMKIENGYTDGSTTYTFDTVPVEPGFYQVLNDETAPINDQSSNFSWVVMTCSTNIMERFIQIAIRNDGMHYSRTLLVEYVDDPNTGQQVPTGNITRKEWRRISNKTTSTYYTVYTNEWVYVDVTAGNIDLYEVVLDNNKIAETVSIYSRYDIYTVNDETLSMLQSSGVQRLTVYNRNGDPVLCSYGNKPSKNLELEIQVTPVEVNVITYDIASNGYRWIESNEMDSMVNPVTGLCDVGSEYLIDQQLGTVQLVTIAGMNPRSASELDKYMDYYFKFPTDGPTMINQILKYDVSPDDPESVVSIYIQSYGTAIVYTTYS